VSFDLGPSRIAVVVQRAGGSWSGWTEPLADAIGLDTMRLRRVQRHLDRRHRGGSLACFSRDGLHATGRCVWRRCAAGQPTMIGVGELHRRLAEHRKTLLYAYNPRTTALSQTCLCGTKKKPLSQRVHRCGCGIGEDRDLFSAYLGLHVRTRDDGVDRLDLQAARERWLHRQDAGESPKSSRSASARKRPGRRHPPSRRSVARIKARRKAKTVMRPSRSAPTSTTDQPTAIAA
jgi:hypothetical protein